MRFLRATGIVMSLLISLFCLTGTLFASLEPLAPRTVVSLNGEWQIAQGSMEEVPQQFNHTVPVPGLVDMAEPEFQEVGKSSERREAFWYRKTFTLQSSIPEVALLKVFKAKYGTRVYVNGQFVGEHLPNFTPGYFDIKSYLKPHQENELIIRVGAHRESVPEGRPSGWDFEKYLYIPGIYDAVELILTGAPYISNVQIVPDIEQQTAHIIAEVTGGETTAGITLTVTVTEAESGTAVRSEQLLPDTIPAHKQRILNLVIPVENPYLWSPENPFLYELELSIGTDGVKDRFGMRSFRFDRTTGRAVLNGKPYMMRGTNVCIYRFFEDSLRSDLPWREDWVRSLHQTFKSMNWNSIRYCIGFPPEQWYDIADEEGFLIQDEFPIWLLNRAPENPQAEYIIPEYREWMRERWNHPCVVIWDAQNESGTQETEIAIQAVRHLDHSNRPWENGWENPQSPVDAVESHPYLFIRDWREGEDSFRFEDIAEVSGIPNLRDSQKEYNVPIIINEYGWLWLTRDGRPTTLTKNVYKVLLGPNSTVAQRRLIYARYLAALTELWRTHRNAAAVLHFCGLTYSRPGDVPRPEGGATSDHFLDLESLTLEPHFENYVKQAFNPVGLMLDFWEEELPGGQGRSFPVYIVNDLHEKWEGDVTLRITAGDETIASQSQPCVVSALGRKNLSIRLSLPEEPGNYTIIAELSDEDGELIQSLRDVEIVD